MKEKRLGRYFEIGAIVLLFVFAIGCEIGRGSGNKEIGIVEKLEYKVSGKLKEQILEIWVAGLKGAHRETVLDGGKEVGSPRLNIDPEQAEFLVIDNRGKASLLGYADKETFLRDFGFEGKEPFYQYVDEESGMLWMELYFDEDTAKGCGIRYFPEDKRDEKGFVFNSSYKPLYNEYNHILRSNDKEELYSKLTYDGYDPSQSTEIEDFNEKTEYTADGKMKHYIATGWMTYMSDEKDISTLVEMDFVYREDGTLQRKDRSHNWAYGGTWYSMIHSCYDNKERLIFEDCYITHGSMDYYYIYEGDEDEPSYYLVIDHDLGDLYAEMYSCHDITGEENGKCYGKIGPDLSDNSYVQAVRKANETLKYNGGSVSHTYCMDYDGDGRDEAFVIIGEYRDWLSGEPTEDFIDGSAWFVDSEKRVVYLDTAAFRTYQEYVWQDGKGYLFLHHSVGLPWETDIYSVKENQPCEVFTGRTALLKEDGQVIQVQDAYDSTYDLEAEAGFWSGHTWKPYPFLFEHGEWKEVPAKEVSRKQVDAMAMLPDAFDESQYDGVQYIFRENGELNINVAKEDADFHVIVFSYFTYQLNEQMEWNLMDEGPGIYLIQLHGESHWDYLDEIKG